LSLEDFLANANIDKKTRARFKKASEVERLVLPTASIGLNLRLGGGIPRGSQTLIYGNTSSGKSLLTMQTIGKLQKMGLTCAYVDAEGTFEPSFAARLGVDNEELLYVKEKSIGAITDAVVPLMESDIDFVAIDSISMALAENFVEDDGDVKTFENMKQMASHAKSLSIMVNALSYANKSTALVLISQMTTKFLQNGIQNIPHGGQKVPFASSQIIKLMSAGSEKEQIKGDDYFGDQIIQSPVARKVNAYVEKNKLGPQSKNWEYILYYSGKDHPLGVDNALELISLGTETGIVDKAGSWYTYDGIRAQGQISFSEEINKDPELANKLEKEVWTVLTGEVDE